MTANLRDAVLAAADAVDAARDELCRLDAVAGDGDHGVTMALGARSVRRILEEDPDLAGAALLSRIALGAGSVGGAIGPIYATALLRVAAAWRASEPHHGPPTVAELLACAEAAAAAITALGGAAPGDKTIVDALAPVVSALAEADRSGSGVPEALAAAAAAARAGADSTAGMIATLGRASRLGERGRGSADPGASSFAIILAAVVGVALDDPDPRP